MSHVIELSSSDDEVQPRPVEPSGPIIEFLSSDGDEARPPHHIESQAPFSQPSAIREGARVSLERRRMMLVLGAINSSDEDTGARPTRVAPSPESMPPARPVPGVAE